MATTPDPLANNPAIRDWAERFFRIKSWTMPDGMDQQGDDVVARRTAALAALSKITIAPVLSSGARQAFAGGYKALKQEAMAAVDVDAFDAIDAGIQSLGDDIATQMVIATARVKAQAALKSAEDKFEAVSSLLDQGSFTYLEKLLGAARGLMAKAVAASEFKSVDDASADFLKVAGEAETYGAYFDTWTRATLLLINSIDTDDQKAATDARAAQMKVATAESVNGDFAKAKTALEDWKSNLDTADNLADAVAFGDKLEKYEKDYAKRAKIILSSQVFDAGDYSSLLKDAKDAAYAKKDFVAANKHLDDLIAYLSTNRQNLAIYLRGFDMRMMGNAEFKTAVLAAKKTQEAKGSNKPGQARKDLITWAEANADIMSESKSKQIVASLGTKYEALKKTLRDPELADLNATWEAHRLLVVAKNFDATDGAPKYHPKLETLFKLARVTDQRGEMDRIVAKFPAAGTYEIRKPLEDALTAGNYDLAIASVPKALELMRAMPEYLTLKADVEDVLAALPPTEATLVDPLKKAVSDAEILAIAGKPVEGSSVLKLVLENADYLEIATALADYRAKLAQIEKTHSQVKKFLKLPSAEAALDLSLRNCKDKAETEQKYGDAFLMLERHKKLLAQAKPMATARFQVGGIINALKRAAVPSSELDPIESKIPAAEDEARKPDFAKALSAFDAILASLEALSKEAAEAYEMVDGIGSNAGHSLDRHGPDVTDPELIRRLKTGEAPNAKAGDAPSYTGASSRFESPQDWIAGRELAAQAALAKGVDISQKEMAYTGDLLTSPEESADFTVEHGRAIDKAFIGKKKEVRLTEGAGDIVFDKTYETYEEIEGLTRAYVNFIWEPEAFVKETTALPVDPTEHAAHKPQDNADYAKEYKKRHGTDPTKIPGRWVMMQQYPVADGWDNELKAYTNNDPGNMIP
ncbi:hypothetical protein [Roseobacter sp. GAI101]|uniref:hypothetical protein n=1 Tax=Roseobacter sp. (strain GAI101) TaxID=391589 RepID=UPI0001871E1E|nr:hypothetical protein [Roseobacter sp. GAI101]EEB86027.1 hypothetical protein RGAI101_3183 [Roseobacter sp. GAI101]